LLGQLTSDGCANTTGKVGMPKEDGQVLLAESGIINFDSNTGINKITRTTKKKPNKTQM